MGKNKGSRKSKNVFKVAKVRSMKLKTKAQKVVTNLKKLDSKGGKSSNRDKTANVDQLLEEIRKDMKTSNFKKTDNISKNKSSKKPLVNKVSAAQTDAATLLVKQMQLS